MWTHDEVSCRCFSRSCCTNCQSKKVKKPDKQREPTRSKQGKMTPFGKFLQTLLYSRIYLDRVPPNAIRSLLHHHQHYAFDRLVLPIIAKRALRHEDCLIRDVRKPKRFFRIVARDDTAEWRVFVRA